MKNKKFWIFSIAMIVAMMALIVAGEETGIHPTQAEAMATLAIGVSLDIVSTYLCFINGGKEQNPAAAWVIKKISIFGLFGVVALIWVAIFWFIVRDSNIYAQAALAITYWAVPVNNFLVLKRLLRVKASKRAQTVTN
jgi:membrane-associated HD superfamily phosphohydrolase